MLNHPMVSIITPTYNHDKYIAKCIEGVLAQTYTNWEQIIIDDGSTDRTADIIAEYSDRRIHYTRQKNKGIWRLAEMYNDALKQSRGEFIAILEGDDFWPSAKLEHQIAAHEGRDAVLSWGKARIVDGAGNLRDILPKDMSHFQNRSHEGFLGELLFANPIHSCTVICRKSALEAVGGFMQPQGLPYVDEPTWLQLSLQGEFLPLDEVLGCYRRHERQVTSSMMASMIRASRYSVDFYNGLPSSVRDSLIEKVPGLDELVARKDLEFDYYLGRANLLDEDYSLARENFMKALRKGHPALKAKALLGIGCSLLRLDLDRLDNFSKKMKLRENK